MVVGKKIITVGLILSLLVVNTANVQALSQVEKIQGKDKYEIAVKVADKQKFTTAIIVNADNSVADGLSASGLSGVLDAPILLTSKDTLATATSNKLKSVKKVYIIGGTSAISTNVENTIRAKGIEVKRIGGNDRIETSYNVAKEIASIKSVTKIMLTNAYKGEADAMSIAPVAVRDDAPIILTNGNTIPFNAKNIESYVIGGSSIMTDKLVKDTNSTRLGGIDRFDTNKQIINKFYAGVNEFHITKGWTLTDALITAPIAKNAPTLFAENGSDKTILSGAEKLTFVGDIDNLIIEQCIYESNKNQTIVDEYTESLFNQEMDILSSHIDSLIYYANKDWSYVYSYARHMHNALINVYNYHLSINSNSELYNRMTDAIYYMCMHNLELANEDITSARLWFNMYSNAMDKVFEVAPRSKYKNMVIPDLYENIKIKN